jgi:hypothetical protein
MTPVPPPASPCLRVRLDYTQTDGFLGGNRFYLSYAGSAPTPGNCTSIAAGIEAAWLGYLSPEINQDWALTEVDVLDITTESGSSGQWAGTESGGVEGTALPGQCAVNVEFGIARRYRGGKPRMFLPPCTTAQQQDAGHWSADYVSAVNTAVGQFFTAIAALDIGTVGALSHVNLSYFKGFTNITNSSGRERAVPTYRATALVDPVESYITKAEIGSQRRRRIATTY